MQRRRAPLWPLVGILASSMIGCNGSKLVAVTGQVTLDDKPLPKARVALVTTDGIGPPALGVTDELGHFEITTVGMGPGVLPGEYRILITKAELNPYTPSAKSDGSSPPDEDPAAQLARATQERSAQRYPQGKQLLPQIYGNPEQTPFTIIVPGKPLELKLRRSTRAENQ